MARSKQKVSPAKECHDAGGVSMQANIARAVKYPSINARNWSLYFFFRILRKPETRPFPQLLGEQITASQNGKKVAGSKGSVGEGYGTDEAESPQSVEEAIDGGVRLAAAALSSGGNAVEAEQDGEAGSVPFQWPDVPDMKQPADAFFAWLKMVTLAEFADQPDDVTDTKTARQLDKQLGGSIDPESIRAQLIKMLSQPGGDVDPGKLAAEFPKLLEARDGPMRAVTMLLGLILSNLNAPHQLMSTFRALAQFGGALQSNSGFAARFLFLFSVHFKVLLSSPDLIGRILAKFEGNPRAAGLSALHGGLPMMCLYEIFRQAAPSVRAKLSGKAAGDAIVRGELEQDAADASKASDKSVDAMPINIAFSFSGLEALNLHPETLRSFPDVFKEGMAARAERLGDTGASAPENWDGALGLRSIHGHFASRFAIGNDEDDAEEAPWQLLRDDIRVFNQRIGPRGKLLRALLGALFRPLGMEIMHLELGQDPYRTRDADGEGPDGSNRRIIVPEKYRREHFGFRDGISQPFIDMNLGTPPSGGGTPRRNRTWDSVARGEIFLDAADEDGHVQCQPANRHLRHDATYEVFRKLEQDVVGFRNFLKSQRSKPAEQERLAAQFMGRWKDGTPLVVAPDTDIDLGHDPDNKTNDFLYAKDDPDGKRCPLGSHIRRANPRDIGGNGDAKRHRMLRRGIAYGGPLLPDDSNGDGEERGLLFVAVNARIDLQFELVQSNWINNGEFLGQAGLGRCPVTGTNSGTSSDRFFEAGAVAPVRHIPRFVTTRGGDYFFLPSVDALRMMAAGEKFEPDSDWPGRGWLDDVVTPSLIQETRIRRYMARILYKGERKITLYPPATPDGGTLPYPHKVSENPLAGDPITFVGRHGDVRRVLADNDGDLLFSVRNYRDACRRTSRGYDLLIGTELNTKSGGTRRRLQEVLKLVWGEFTTKADFHGRLECITKQSIESALHRTSQRGQIDLVRDLATDTVYRIVKELFGVGGPSWLTEIAIALPFKRKQVGDLERDWLSAIKREKPENPGQITLQLWSVIFLADLVGNQLRIGDLNNLARASGSEFMTHLEQLLTKARTQRPAEPDTLLDMFVACEDDAIKLINGLKGPGGDPDYSPEEYYLDVLVLMLELVGTPMSVIPTAWGNVIGGILSAGIDLQTLFAIFGDPEVEPTPGRVNWITRLIYEVDRLNPSFKMFLRRSEQDNVIDKDLTIEENHWVAALAVAANFDECAFPNPTEFSLGSAYGGSDRPLENYLMFGSAGGGRDCWGRDRLALYLMQQFVRACARLDGLRKVAGPNGESQKLLRVTIGQPARFAKQRIKPVA